MRLVVLAGRQRGKVFELGPGRFLLGRAEDCDVRITDIAVSRRHCLLEAQGGEQGAVLLKDLGSSNGTFVDGKEVGKAVLRDGSVLRVGETEMAVSFAPRDVPTTSLRVGSTDMTEFMSGLAFCARCNESIPDADLDEGRAAKIEGRYLCSNCLREGAGEDGA